MKKGTFTRTGRPKSEEKRDAIIDAASDLFLAKGLRATSMDAVAEQAGVSKQTVYSHVKNKEELFREVVITKVESYGFAETALPEEPDLEAALFTMGTRFIDLLLDDEVVAMHRVVIGESVDYPEIAKLFYQTGPGTAIRAIAKFLDQQMQQGRLKTDDPRYTAVLFLNMVRGHYQMQCLMGLPLDIDRAALEAHIRKVVGQFLSLYGKPREGR
ncbi:MAG: TetR/AcrR family transcriptional regulator [Candidatus Competibacteraceae bacterium]|jgi:TetR/AcrR family transcriptional repressor of mexJK operon|nr:TetR/AcrR family transcriptional regulator [Candidatus Competibacteraceae bacterium]